LGNNIKRHLKETRVGGIKYEQNETGHIAYIRNKKNIGQKTPKKQLTTWENYTQVRDNIITGLREMGY
jgi:hypothetical protein